MADDNRTILVTGATGRQGNQVAYALASRGFAVRALTRAPDDPVSREMARSGMEVVRGDMTDRYSLRSALDGVYGVFAMATPYEEGLAAEVLQGTTLGDAAREAGVRHYIYSSVGGAERDSGVPHFETKREIENHLRRLDLPLTILRPAWFYENLNTPVTRRIDDRLVIQMPLRPDTRLQMIAVHDIAEFVARALEDPASWIGVELELAGDELTMDQVAEEIRLYAGIPAEYERISFEAARSQSADRARMYEFFEREGYRADILALRHMMPDLMTLAEWLEGGFLKMRDRRAA